MKKLYGYEDIHTIILLLLQMIILNAEKDMIDNVDGKEEKDSEAEEEEEIREAKV